MGINLKFTYEKMKVLVLLACLGACSAHFLATNGNLGSSYSAPSFNSFSGPSNNFGGNSRILISDNSNANRRSSYSLGSNSGFSSGSIGGGSFHSSRRDSGFRSGGSSFSSGGNSGFSGLGGNSGYTSGGIDVHPVTSIRINNIGRDSSFSSGGSGFSRNGGGSSGYSAGSFSGPRSNNFFASGNQ